MKLSTFRSLAIGDKVQPLSANQPEYVTNQYIQVDKGEAKSFVVVANYLTLGENDAWTLSDEVQHPSPEVYN